MSDIAERAGVNKQLISYYFGGKDGLYDAILERWYAEEDRFDEPGITLDELASRYLRVGLNQPLLQQLFIRELLDDAADDPWLIHRGGHRVGQFVGMQDRASASRAADKTPTARLDPRIRFE